MGEPGQTLADTEPETRTAYSVSMTGKPLLEYETPRKPPPGDPAATMLRVAQRIVFALGAGLLVYGVLRTYIGGGYDGCEAAGWGAALCVLGSPWGWRRAKRTEN